MPASLAPVKPLNAPATSAHAISHGALCSQVPYSRRQVGPCACYVKFQFWQRRAGPTSVSLSAFRSITDSKFSLAASRGLAGRVLCRLLDPIGKKFVYALNAAHNSIGVLQQPQRMAVVGRSMVSGRRAARRIRDPITWVLCLLPRFLSLSHRCDINTAGGRYSTCTSALGYCFAHRVVSLCYYLAELNEPVKHIFFALIASLI